MALQIAGPDAVILVLPADHVLGDLPAFQAAIQRALPSAAAGKLVAFGTVARTPETGYGYLLGLFPVNVLHNLVHLVIGVLGMLAAGRAYNAVVYSRGLAVFYGLLAVMGLFPVLYTTFGLIPIFGNDVWLHGLTAAAAAYFGWSASIGRPEITIETARTGMEPPTFGRPTGTDEVRR